MKSADVDICRARVIDARVSGMPSDNPITAIYTDIGRGHPNYLDSVLRYMRFEHPREYDRIRVVSIFNVSKGRSRMGWNAVRFLYRHGSRGGTVSSVYSRFRAKRSEYDADSILTRLLRRDLIAYLSGYGGVCLVAHPLLANMLCDSHRVYYLHGEITAPPESVVIGAEKVYVPLPETAAKMRSSGLDEPALCETGLVLEPEIRENLESVVESRLSRIESLDVPLTIGFFISGAYPAAHVRLMLAGAESCVASGYRVRFFWGCRKAARILDRIRSFDRDVVLDSGSGEIAAETNSVVVTAGTREKETIRSMQYINHLDMFCAAPHERINWAVGAGLPMIAVGPLIGTFAPENLRFALDAGCCVELSSFSEFESLGPRLTRMRKEGTIAAMTRAGRNIRSVDGAKIIAESLIAALF